MFPAGKGQRSAQRLSSHSIWTNKGAESEGGGEDGGGGIRGGEERVIQEELQTITIPHSSLKAQGWLVKFSGEGG